MPANKNDVVYHPRLVAAADLLFNSARYHIESDRNVIYAVEFNEGPVTIDWDSADDELSVAVAGSP